MSGTVTPKPQSQGSGIPDFGPGNYGASGGYDRSEQSQDSYGAQQYGAASPAQQRKYNPADYANIHGYPAQQQQQQQQPQQPQQARPAQTQAAQQPSYQQSPQQAPAAAKPQQVEAQPAASTAVATAASGVPVPGKKPLPSATDAGTGQRIGLDHFNFLAVLGKGNFGKVMLAETKRSRKLYAIKVLKKEFIIENDEVESIRSEKRVFLVANRERHPFLTNLHACFQTETRVYFVMEYVRGGDLMLHIQRGQFGAKRAQ